MLALLVIALTAAPQAERSAVLCVNTDGLGGCYTSIGAAVAASVDGDTIQVAAGTYPESGILVDKAITIIGAGTDQTTVDGTSTFAAGVAVFQFGAPLSWPARVATISRLTITGGYRGVHAGGCANDITLDHVRITGNGPGSGAGYFNNCGVVRLYHSRIDHNLATQPDLAGCDWGWGGTGGGIASLCGSGANVIRFSTIDHNTASFIGGGLAINDTTTLIENSTISDNVANSSHMDGSVPVVFGGGGIWISGAPRVTIRYTTIADNAAPNGAGGGVHGGILDPTGTLFVSLEASIVSANTALAMSTDLGRPVPGVPTANCGSWWDNSITTHGGNVIGDQSCQITGPGDVIGTAALLSPLASNGGPTPTRTLQSGSVGIDQAPACGTTGATTNTAILLGFPESISVDQRGTIRPIGVACDSGAFEAAPDGDTQPPTIEAHSDVTAEATRRTGAVVGYESPATQDDIDGPGVAVCAPASGALFPLGATVVTCVASDVAGNSASSAFTVRVVDTTAPVFDTPDDIRVPQARKGLRAEVPVRYRAPRAVDVVSGRIVGTCSPAPNTLFPIGVTMVNCSATDDAGNAASTSFSVTVEGDFEAPEPKPIWLMPKKGAQRAITAEATMPGGAVVDIPQLFRDNFDPDPVMTCAPASGSVFPIGTSPTICRARDESGNRSVPLGIDVVVRDTTRPTLELTSPSAGARPLNSQEIVSFSCADTGSGITSCVAEVTTPDNQTLTIVNGGTLAFTVTGRYSLTVTATDAVGLRTVTTINMRAR